MFVLLTMTAVLATTCPAGTVQVDRFELQGQWVACESLAREGGVRGNPALALASENGTVEWFETSYEPCEQNAYLVPTLPHQPIISYLHCSISPFNDPRCGERSCS